MNEEITPSFFNQIWFWLKDNDIPNWVILFFTIILWPVVLFIWNRRIVTNIPNLEVSFSKARARIGQNEHDALSITFLNNTGSIVYITNARILNCSKNFKVHSLASRDIASSSYELKFSNGSEYKDRQIILQTSAEAHTVLSIDGAIDSKMLSYKRHWIRRLLRLRKYFRIQYVAMVGNKRYKVSTNY